MSEKPKEDQGWQSVGELARKLVEKAAEKKNERDT